VDSQKDVAQKYEITAMPTFILIENSKVKKEIKGANPPALNLLVNYARQEVKRAMKQRGEKVTYEEGEEETIVDLEKMPALTSPFDDL
jgi:thioredoxin-related protein